MSWKKRLRKAMRHVHCYPVAKRRTRPPLGAASPAPTCRSQNEVGVAGRGSVNVQECRVLSDEASNCIVSAGVGRSGSAALPFLQTISGSAQSFHLKANNEVDRVAWLKAIEYTRHRLQKSADLDEEEELGGVASPAELKSMVESVKSSLDRKLQDVRAAEASVGECLRNAASLIRPAARQLAGPPIGASEPSRRLGAAGGAENAPQAAGTPAAGGC